jgi:diguanylate cyclase (GGDEF)-like protein/excisionase family DNA binding protein
VASTSFDDWIAIEEAATYLAIPVRTLYRLAQYGRLPATKVGRTWRFKRSLLDAHLETLAARPPFSADPLPAPVVAGEIRDGPPHVATPDVLGELSALADLSVRLAGILETSEILRFVCHRLLDLFAVANVGAMRIEEAPHGDVLVPETIAPERPVPPFRLPIGASAILTEVVRSQQPVVVDDLPGQAEVGQDLIASFGVRSGVLVPIVDMGRVWGIFALTTTEPRHFEPVEIKRLVAIAAQAGAAITNARLLAQARRRTEELQAIEALARELNRSRTVQEVGDIVARGIGSLIDYDGLRFYVLQPDGQTLEAITLFGRVDYYADETPDLVRLNMGEGLGGTIARAGVGELIGNVLADARMQDIPGTDEVDESMLVMPFVYEDEVLGVIELSRLGLDQFDESDLRVMQIFAAQTSVALFNARQVEELERRSADLERQLASQRQLLNITERLLKTRQPAAIFEAIADTLSEVVPHDTLTIYLVDEAGGVLVPVLARDEYAQQILDSRLPLGQGITGDVVRRGEAEMVNDTVNDTRVVHVPGTPDDEDEAIIVVPLHNPSGVIGALNLYRIGAAFQDGELELAKLYANHAAIALENANVHEELLRAARTDALTGLRHHGGFRDALAHALETTSPVSLLMVDLDDFKAYNDRYGHQAGDRLLQRLGARLVASVRAQDVVCRYGGDEFAIVLPDTNEVGARAVAEKVLTTINETAGGRQTRVGASIGIACSPTDARLARDLVAVADTSLYVAKHLGRGRAVAASELPTHIHHLRDLLAETMAGVEGETDDLLDVVSLVRPIHEVLRQQVPDLALYAERTAAVCSRLAPAYGLAPREAAALHAAALVSDVGRLVAADEADGHEDMIAFAHPVLAARLLEPYPALAGAAAVVRHHHERWDGTGYPDELGGEDVPPQVRLLNVAQLWVTLRTPRDGSPGIGRDEALAVIRSESGGRLAPDAVDVLAAEVTREPATA